MEFAQWVVAGLDRYRLHQLPDGQTFFDTVWNRLGTDPRLTAFLNSGDPASRQALVELVAQATAQDPAFAEALRAAAPGGGAGTGAAGAPATVSAPVIGAGGGAAGFGGGYGAGAGGPDGSGYGGVGAPGTGAGPGTGKPSFFKTTGGIAALVAGALAVVGGGIALAVSGGGGGGGGVVDKLQGTWQCATKAGSGSGAGDGTTIAVVVGDGTFSAQGLTGVWKVSGGSLTAGTTDKPTGVTIKGIPDGYGPVHATAVNNANPEDGTLQMDGTVSQSALDLKLTVAGAKDTQQNGELFELTCTR